VEATFERFKGLLVGFFFFPVGMAIDVHPLLREPLLIAGAVAGLIGIKSLLIVGLARLFRLSWPVAVEMGLLLGAGGEFAFVSLVLAAGSNLVDRSTPGFAAKGTAVAMDIV